MIIIDAQLSPNPAPWIQKRFSIECFSASFLGSKAAKDSEIFEFARARDAIVITKDDDFVQLQNRFGPPPKIIWLTVGNTSNAFLKAIFETKLSLAIQILENESLVEITSLN